MTMAIATDQRAPQAPSIRQISKHHGIAEATLRRRLKHLPMSEAVAMVRRMRIVPANDGTFRQRGELSQTEVRMVTNRFREGLPASDVGFLIGLTRERTRQIESVAQTKMKIGLAICRLLGMQRAEPVLIRLTGKSLTEFRRALTECRKAVR
jgi:DNA-binding transcriptional regulator YhcF (GntR family)